MCFLYVFFFFFFFVIFGGGGGWSSLSSIYLFLSSFFFSFFLFLGDGLIVDRKSQSAVKSITEKPTSHSGEIIAILLNLTGFWNIFNFIIVSPGHETEKFVFYRLIL